MPPAKKKPRTYDHARTRAAVLAQFHHVRDAVRELEPEQLARPSGVGDWSVAELAAHIAWIADSLAGGLARPPAAVAELSAAEWPFATASLAGKIAEAAKETLEGAPLAELYDRAGARLAEALEANPGGRVLDLWIGAMTLADFLVTRTVELVVHTEDLRRATGLDIPWTARPWRPAPGCSPTPSRSRLRAGRWSSACRRSRWCSASRGPGTPAAPRRTWWRPTR